MALTATAGSGQATVNFTPPVATGPIGYVVMASPGAAHASGTSKPITVGGLKNGTAYRFTVTATNLGGTSPVSAASNSVTPYALATASHASPSGVAKRHPKLVLTVAAFPPSPKLKSVAITLPQSFTFAKRQLRNHVLVGGKRVRGSLKLKQRTLTVTLTNAAAKLPLTITSPALSARASLVKQLKRKHKRPGPQTVSLKTVDAARNTSALKLKLSLH
jgi:hypothetical protein